MQTRTVIAVAAIFSVAIITLFLVADIGVFTNGSFIGAENNIDFVAGSNMTITGATNPATDTNTITFSASSTATSTGDITDVFDCSSGDCQSITVSDGDLLDFSSVNSSTSTEGLIIPQNTTCNTSGGTADGQLCWDSDTSTSTPGLYIGDGVSTTSRRVTQPFYTITFIAGRAAANIWSNMPTSTTRLFADRVYIFTDLTGYEEYRIHGSMGVSCLAGGDLNLQFADVGAANPPEPSFTDAHAGSEGEAPCDGQTILGEFTSLVSAAQINQVWLRIVGKDGNGIADPSFTIINVDFR